jgi:hypothetical protein
MSEPKLEELPPIRCADGVELPFWRMSQPDGEQVAPVLLLHGMSARHESFRIPCSDAKGEPRSLAGWLHRAGYEPWLLDWRGGCRVVASSSPEALRDVFDLDHAAREDIRLALERIGERRSSPWIGAVGHCMGAAALAQAIAAGDLERTRLKSVVLLTLGLFYALPPDSRLKTQDYLLERYLARREVVRIDPARLDDWPRELHTVYDNWPSVLRPHTAEACSHAESLCNQLSFMYGVPYYERNLVPEIHGGLGGGAAELPQQFGPLALRMYAQAASNARRGWAAKLTPGTDERYLLGQESRDHFDRLHSVTLITGQRNQIWHRSSIDRMYEWLTRGRKSPTKGVQKHVLADYGHQDLLWGCEARRDVFPKIRDGLRVPREEQEEISAGIRRQVRRRGAPESRPEP